MIELIGGEKTLAKALKSYNQAWKDVLKNFPELEKHALVNTLSWKVADKQTLIENVRSLANNTDQVHIGTVNNRFIASIALKKPVENFWIVKILERRIGSNDTLGLDSLDYLVDDMPKLKKKLATLKNIQLETQSNDVHAWLSMRFGPTYNYEAKFVDHLVLEVARKELKLASSAILQKLTFAYFSTELHI